MHEEILDTKRKEAITKIAQAGAGFYLAGGTALALHIGHRDSIDFDFFQEQAFDTEVLFRKLEHIFEGGEIRKLQEEENTLTVLLDKEILVSFFTYQYPLLHSTVMWNGIELASIEDIAVMKLAAIIGRATTKDYVDLYFILQNHTLDSLLHAATKKVSTFNQMLALKSLVYFDDVVLDPIRYMPGHEVVWEEVKILLAKTVRAYEVR
jgi:hypothetical protein